MAGNLMLTQTRIGKMKLVDFHPLFELQREFQIVEENAQFSGFFFLSR